MRWLFVKYHIFLNKLGWVFPYGKNWSSLFEEENITILNRKAKFISDKIIQITKIDDTKIHVKKERIFINTGSKSINLSIDGLNKSKNILDLIITMEQ